ncbi:MAG: class I SAM-dependent methyltransferase [Sphingomonas sp.]|nr:class I SAM-dependent methyltransferase [Sphingomonas sp.]
MTDGDDPLDKYERIARFYDFVDLPFEHLRYRSIRPLLFRDLNGRLLDAGVGTGRNLAFYPRGSEVFGVDLSPAMLKHAARRSKNSGASVHLVEMDLTRLAFADDFFDAAVASFVFCTMPAKARTAALRELARVVRPDGRVRLLEYAPAQTTFRRAVARVWQPWARWAFGAKLQHDIEPELAEASLEVISSCYVSSSIKLIGAKPAT